MSHPFPCVFSGFFVLRSHLQVLGHVRDSRCGDVGDIPIRWVDVKWMPLLAGFQTFYLYCKMGNFWPFWPIFVYIFLCK